MSASTQKLGAILLFWIGVGLIQIFNWGNGIPKAAVMALMLAATPLALSAMRRAAPLQPGLGRGIAIAFWLALALDIAYLGARIVAPHVIDIATTTLAAGQALLHGANPYAQPIDTISESTGFTGYKYLPVMIFGYLPLGAPYGERGVLVTNLIVLLACLALMRHIAGARVAPLLLLSLPLVAEQLFAKGATDLLAVVPLIGALALLDRGSFWCGVCVGLSLATKLLPGLAMLPALIPPRRRGAFATGLVLGLVPILPFFAADPASFIGNVLLFNLARRADDTSWHYAMPAITTAVHVIFAAAILAAAIYVWRAKPPLGARCALAAMLGIGAILAGPGAHHNYQLWWLPFYALLLSAALAPAGRFGYTGRADIAAKGI